MRQLTALSECDSVTSYLILMSLHVSRFGGYAEWTNRVALSGSGLTPCSYLVALPVGSAPRGVYNSP